MRDPDRIGPFLGRLAAFWEQHPDWRFGQLVLNVSRDARGRIRDVWEWDVDEFLGAMENFKDEVEMTDEELFARVKAQMPGLDDDLITAIVKGFRIGS